MRSWALLQNAVADRSLGELQPISAEVTYINRFTLEDGETRSTRYPSCNLTPIFRG